MKPCHHRYILIALAILLFAATAGAEGIFPVNESGTGTWAFDQAATVAGGSRINVAFIGDSAGTGQFRLYYAAVEGGANFQDNTLQRSKVILTPATVIDSGASYTDARHPRIALRTGNQMIIVFQAVPAGLAPGDYRLFRALVTVDNNTVSAQNVSEILDAGGVRLPGALVDPSFRAVTTDNSLRMAYTQVSAGVGNVYYARVGMDSARLAASPILLSSVPSSQGAQPLPRLRLDGNNNSHIVWAANNAADTPSGIYYAMVKTVPPSTADFRAIGATQVLYGGFRWGFPSLLVVNPGSVWVLAAEEPFGSPGLAGSVGITALNPYAVTHDGNPVNVNNLGANSRFFLTPPGGSVMAAAFDMYHPEAELDPLNRANVAGYGFRGDPPLYQGTPGRYYTMGLGSTASSAATAAFASFASFPVSVGTGDAAFAMETPGDYTRPAFSHFNGRAVLFWSGPDGAVAGARNLYVTSVSDAFDPTSQSGCSAAGAPMQGNEGTIPEAALLLLPAALLLARRAARKAFAR
jgi:hypothetical protein